MSNKLRYYLRGVGVGMFVTALILLIMNKCFDKPVEISDAEVRARAAALGMVDASTISLTEAQNLEQQTRQPEEQQPEEQQPEEQQPEEQQPEEQQPEEQQPEEQQPEEQQPDEQQPEEQQPEEQQPEEQQPEEQQPEEQQPEEQQPEEQQPEEQQPEEQQPEEQQPEEQQPEEQKPEAPATGEIVVITVSRGNGSETVAKNCQSAGLVEDADAFNKFMIQNGYSTVLRVGSFEIPTGSDMETVAKLLTGK